MAVFWRFGQREACGMRLALARTEAEFGESIDESLKIVLDGLGDERFIRQFGGITGGPHRLSERFG